MLVAPVTIGADATTAAGSTITQDAPAGQADRGASAPGRHRRVAAPGQAARRSRHSTMAVRAFCPGELESMCGIVGAVAGRDIVPILMEGLRRLEYRGYDSAGIAVVTGDGHVARLRTVGKVRMLQEALIASPTAGNTGIAHTRWATHGAPSERNAHPQVSRDGLAVVHNGIIENYVELRSGTARAGLPVRVRDRHRGHRAPHPLPHGNPGRPVQGSAGHGGGTGRRLRAGGAERSGAGPAHPGAHGLPGGDRTWATDENFVASDAAALLPVTRRFQFLEEGDIAEVRARGRAHPGSPAATRVGARHQGQRAVGRRRGEGRVRAFHAQGNPRAAARGGQHAAGTRGQWPPAGGGVRAQGGRAVSARRVRAHRGLRHQLSRRRGGAVFHRADLPHSAAASRSPANIATAMPWCRRTRCS